MQIEDLVKQFSKQSTAELLERVRELRRSRQTKKAMSNKPADRPKTKEKATSSIVDMFNNLSESERQNIAAMLTAAQKK